MNGATTDAVALCTVPFMRMTARMAKDPGPASKVDSRAGFKLKVEAAVGRDAWKFLRDDPQVCCFLLVVAFFGTCSARA